MATAKALDKYANVAAIQVTESAANTQTSAKFAFPFSIMDKTALLISRIEYDLQSWDSFNSSNDLCTLALIAAASVVNMRNPIDPLIIDWVAFKRLDIGAAASGLIGQVPTVKDFTNLPGGGILVAPNPLYFALAGVGCAGVNTANIRIFYSYMELGTEDYWQLVESRRLITS